MAVDKWDKKIKNKISNSMLEYNKCVRKAIKESGSVCGNKNKIKNLQRTKKGIKKIQPEKPLLIPKKPVKKQPVRKVGRPKKNTT